MYTAGVERATAVPSQRGGVASALLSGVSALDDEALTERARELAGEISAAEANLAAVLAEVERRDIHCRWECQTIERFAGWHCQVSWPRAHSLAAVGRAMGELPTMAEAVSDGMLSFDKAKCVAKSGEVSTEGALVSMAVHATTSQTQRICATWRRATLHDDSPNNGGGPVVDRRPTVIAVTDSDGIDITVRFDHVRGQLVLAAIDSAARQVRRERKTAAPVDPTDVNDPTGIPGCDEDRPIERLTQAEWRAEGLLRLAEDFAADTPEGLRPSGFDTTVMVHVGIDTLWGPDMQCPAPGAGNHTTKPVPVARPNPAREPHPAAELGRTGDDVPAGETPGCCGEHRHRVHGPADDEPGADGIPPGPGNRTHPPGSPPTPDPTDGKPRRDAMAQLEPSGHALRRDIARWLACDAGILTAIEDPNGEPLHLGPRTNPITPALRRAVHARHRTCAWPGCCATAVRLHHTHHRSRGGHDDIENLAPECPTHHRAIHLHGIAITREPDGTYRHWRPDHTEILANPHTHLQPVTDALTAPTRLTQRRLHLGADPHETARMPRWQGDPLQLAYICDALVTRRDNALQRTHPTGAPADGTGLGTGPPPSLN